MKKWGDDSKVGLTKFGKVMHDTKTGLWWSKDLTQHGDSVWKVFKNTSEGLEWVSDADKFGDFIKMKHKSAIGKLIPWKEIKWIK